MVSFENLILDDNTPIYQQILDFVRRGIVAGTISDGEELPSRRVLSALLGVNPNTVQRACRLLEEEGLVVSHTGAKSCISVDDARRAEIRRELRAEEARAAARRFKSLGLTAGEAAELLVMYWEGGEKDA